MKMTSPKIIIAASILGADLAHLQEEVDSIATLVDWIQVDVMDGHFVPNLTFGAPVMKHVKTDLPLDMHLMVSNPADRLPEFLALKPYNITFHAEAVPKTADRRALIAAIRAGGAKAAIAINPGTPVTAVDDVIDDIDMVLVMSVQPGFAGQAFRPEVLEKVRILRKNNPLLMIQMDGGIDAKTAPLAVEAGCNNLVAASAIFAATDRRKAIAALRNA